MNHPRSDIAPDRAATNCGCSDASACRPGANVGAAPAPSVALSTLREGDRATVASVGVVGEDERLLTSMGLGIGAEVLVCRVGEPCIVAVLSRCGSKEAGSTPAGSCSCRIGLARALASQVRVVARS